MSAVRHRLRFGFGAVLVTLVACGGLGIVALAAVRANLQRGMQQEANVSGRLSRASDATLRFVALSQAVLMAPASGVSDSLRERRLDSLTASAADERDGLVQASSLGTAERVTLERIGAAQSALEVRFAVARAYRDIGRPADAFRQATLAMQTVDTLFDAADLIGGAQNHWTAVTLARAESLVAQWRLALLGLLVIGLGLGIFSTRNTVRAVTRPLVRLTDAARALGDGDLRVGIAPDGLDDEYAAFARAFADTASRLRVAIAEVQREADDVADAASALTAASSATAASTGEISEAVQMVATAATAQRESLAASGAAIGHVTRSTHGLSEAASQARQLGDEVRAGASRVRDGLSTAVLTLDRLATVVRTSGEGVDQLRATAETVQTFVDRVREIAEQSNLLALNAAIEAARAGDQGRGFGVVADEVRKLATQSGEAATEAARIVRGMRDQFVAASQSYRASVTEIGDVNQVSDATSQALVAIDGAVAGTGVIASAVGTAADTSRQAVGILIAQVQATTRQADEQGSRAEGAAAAAEQTAATAQEVAATAAHLADSATRLRTVASRFRV